MENNKKKRFSIVIPLYNKEISIESTLQSVLEQTYKNFEVIVVNDGSTDNSAALVEEINDSRVRLIHQENKGVSAARNRGIKEAKYEWLSFLDADDIWYPNHLKVTSELIDEFREASVYSTNWSFDRNKKDKERNNRPNKFYIDNYFEESVERDALCSSTVTINTKCFQEVGLFDKTLTHGEDRLMWIRLANKFRLAKTLNITAVYRLDTNNRSIETNRGFNEKFIEKLLKHDNNKYFKNYIQRDLIWRFKRCLKYDKNIDVLKYLFKYKNYIDSKIFIKYLLLCLMPIGILHKMKNNIINNVDTKIFKIL